MARTRSLKHTVDLDAPDEEHVRVATGFAYGLAISAALWTIGAIVVLLLL